MSPATSCAWPAADHYRYLDGAGLADLAWEWLRRDPGYRRRAHDHADASADGVTIIEAAPGDCTDHWGCLNMPGVGLAWIDAPILWSAAVDPSVLKVVARPARDSEQQAFDLDRCRVPAALARGRGCEHLLLRSGHGSVRLDILSGTLLEGPVALLFDFATVDAIEPALSALRRFLHFSRSGTLPRALSHGGQRLRRQILALRIHDAIAAGASIRDVGIMLFGIERVRDEWAGEALKSQCRRLIALAREMAAGGYVSCFR
jgi:hypothetical protein